jgi:hypothetical protein
MIGRWCACAPTGSLSFRARGYSPSTRVYVRLLGPCFKTGGIGPVRQHPENNFPQSTPGHYPRVKHADSRLRDAAIPPRRRYPPARTDADTHRSCAQPRGRTTSNGGMSPIPFPFSNFKPFSPPFRGAFHLSLTVLVRYRSLADI